MDFKRINEDIIEIIPGERSPEEVLEEMAQLSYETAESPLPRFVFPFEVPVSRVAFKDLVTDKGLHMDYLNGKLCSTYVEIEGDRLFFDARRFTEDRGAPEALLNLLKQRERMKMDHKSRILFLCTGNSCRSQMAEAWTNALKGDWFEAYSAGVRPKGIDPLAVEAMAEAGIDISKQESKDIDSFGDMEFDYVVTLCDNARESCPFFPAKTGLIHHGFDDPPKLAETTDDKEEIKAHYRRVRDQIRVLVESFPEGLTVEDTGSQ